MSHTTISVIVIHWENKNIYQILANAFTTGCSIRDNHLLDCKWIIKRLTW